MLITIEITWISLCPHVDYLGWIAITINDQQLTKILIFLVIVWYLNCSPYLIYYGEDTKEEEDGDAREKIGMMWYDVNHGQRLKIKD